MTACSGGEDIILVSIVIWAILPLFLIPLTIIQNIQKKRLKQELDCIRNNPVKRSETGICSGSISYQHPSYTGGCVNASDQISESENKKDINSNLILILGVILIILAGLIFSTTRWAYMTNQAKTISVISVSVVFFAVCEISERKLRLNKTGIAFFILGGVFLPVSVLAMAFFNLFGTWFSMTGRGCFIVYMTFFLLAGLVSFAGVLKYKVSLCAYMSLQALSFSLFFLSLHFENDLVVTVVMGVSSFLAMAFKTPCCDSNIIKNVYYRSFERFAVVNIILTGMLSNFNSLINYNNIWHCAFAAAVLTAGTLWSAIRLDLVVLKTAVSAEVIWFAVCAAKAVQTLSEYTVTEQVTSVVYLAAFLLFTFVPAVKNIFSQSVLIFACFMTYVIASGDLLVTACLFISVLVLFLYNKNNTVQAVSAWFIPCVLDMIFLITLDSCTNLGPVVLKMMTVTALSCLSVASFIFLLKSNKKAEYLNTSADSLAAITAAAFAITDFDAAAAALAAGILFSVKTAVCIRLKKGRSAGLYMYTALLLLMIYAFTSVMPTLRADRRDTTVMIVLMCIWLAMVISGLLLKRINSICASALVNMSAVSLGVAFIYNLYTGDGDLVYIILFSFAAYFAAITYIKKTKDTRVILLSTAAVFFQSGVIFQNAVDIPEIIKDEYYLAAAGIILLAWRFIWEDRHTLDIIAFVYAVISTVFLMLRAIWGEKEYDAIILAVLLSVTMTVSYLLNQKLWLRFSGSSLIVLVLYITRSFWLSIEWWVYLLCAGAGFIAFSGINEYKKIRGTIKEKNNKKL
ncbi:MAG: hypothetical protein Q4F95_11265 [Oscillospiraceae bacterium]|nr:hypothetical protein [Oscillospiraceae bacterium]